MKLKNIDWLKLTILSILYICTVSTRIGVAQEMEAAAGDAKLARIAMTDPPENDWDYALMGEFIGLIQIDKELFSPLGLQLRPLGPANFEAVQFIGGLPGQEGYQAEQILQLSGRRFEEYMTLTGGPWVIIVEQSHCLVLDRHGKLLGRLERIERGSPTMGARPPTGATVLFDGSNLDQFVKARITDDGWLMAGADLLPMFQDFNLHVEFRLPYMPNSDDQARGNSGCYLQSRYEVQILDSFAQLPKFNGAASLYRMKAPEMNMSFPPLVWQTYDIMFTAPRWGSDGSKLRSAHITVWHNGVKVHDNQEIPGKTGAGREEEPTLLPIRFQDHRDPVVFRNIWIIDRGLTEGIAFPVASPTPEQLEAEKAEAERAALENSSNQPDQPDQSDPSDEIPT
jgi:hypothetical protein